MNEFYSAEISVDQMITVMEQKYGQANRVWVMDQHMVNKGNLAQLRPTNTSYVVGTPDVMLRRFERELSNQWDWHAV